MAGADLAAAAKADPATTVTSCCCPIVLMNSLLSWHCWLLGLQVFKEVVVGTKLDGEAGMQAWKNCLDFGPVDGTDPIKLLDEELAAQTGNDSETTIAILPTVRVNNRQYRGVLEPPSVLRAICAGFPTGNEPSVCNEEWVSDNECRQGNEGWTACNSG